MADDRSWKDWKVVDVPSIVQELAAAGVDEPPTRYVLPEQDRPSAAVPDMPEPIPVVDLSRLPDAGEAAKLRSAMANWGFFLAVGHGLEPEFLGEVTRAARDFFKLPLEQKKRYTNLTNGNEFKTDGYGNDMVVSEKQILDWCDRLYLLVEPEPQRTYNLWPSQPPSFRDVLSEYTARCREVTCNVMKNLAKLLDLQEDCFTGVLDDKAATYARFNYYPRCPMPDRVFGLKPHSDGSAITVVLVDGDVTGLQVQNNGAWYNVPVVPNALLLNLGDAMEIMSNGVYKSPVHRVVTNAERERLSLVMFYSVDMERDLEPVAELVDEARPRMYRKMKNGDYVAELFRTFATGTRAIDTVKIKI